MDKTLYIVSTPIGNLGDITYRAVETLKNSDLILCEDTRVSTKLLSHFSISKPLMKYEKFSEGKVSSGIKELFDKYNTISVITDAGTPGISDPGSVIVKAARENGFNIFAIPGASAAIYNVSTSGLDNNNFCFLGFLPRKDGEQKKLFESLSLGSENINMFVFYESPLRIISTLENLKSIATENVYVVKEATKLHEKQFFGKLDEILGILKADDKTGKGEYVVSFTIPKTKNEKSEKVCLEKEIVGEVFDKNISVKEAIKNLSNKFPRNELYKSSLNLKNLK